MRWLHALMRRWLLLLLLWGRLVLLLLLLLAIAARLHKPARIADAQHVLSAGCYITAAAEAAAASLTSAHCRCIVHVVAWCDASWCTLCTLLAQLCQLW